MNIMKFYLSSYPVQKSLTTSKLLAAMLDGKVTIFRI